MSGRKVALIGIDAGDIGLIRSWLHEPPHLRASFEQGRLIELRPAADGFLSAVADHALVGRGDAAQIARRHLEKRGRA